ncbi:Pogo transposable element with KRAB domainlike [Phytophthora palmivora]|uniref:Pogo transposable element with KRAB domainlike n=1 Tax=Phytophthora palmivora TaxID=4796 RepID=A0A2P4XSS8_9STRA|nr:Pogo transposable element with KRAB domainlike [Phytophthora palmivora]
MSAHISKVVKAKCSSRDIQLCVIPGGLTAYLQAGDIGIYKQFKDNLCSLIDDWKNSDRVEYTRQGNPRPPSIEVVADWVHEAWRDTDQCVVENSIASAGFSPIPDEWFIWKHDVYGRKFQQRWNEEEKRDKDYDDSGAEDEFADALDDITIIDR